MTDEFDFSKPFTLKSFFEHFEIEGLNNPQTTRKVVAALKEKGYTKRYVKREYLYAKWPERKEFTMPEIP